MPSGFTIWVGFLWKLNALLAPSRSILFMKALAPMKLKRGGHDHFCPSDEISTSTDDITDCKMN